MAEAGCVVLCGFLRSVQDTARGNRQTRTRRFSRSEPKTHLGPFSPHRIEVPRSSQRLSSNAIGFGSKSPILHQFEMSRLHYAHQRTRIQIRAHAGAWAVDHSTLSGSSPPSEKQKKAPYPVFRRQFHSFCSASRVVGLQRRRARADYTPFGLHFSRRQPPQLIIQTLMCTNPSRLGARGCTGALQLRPKSSRADGRELAHVPSHTDEGIEPPFLWFVLRHNSCGTRLRPFVCVLFRSSLLLFCRWPLAMFRLRSASIESRGSSSQCMRARSASSQFAPTVLLVHPNVTPTRRRPVPKQEQV